MDASMVMSKPAPQPTAPSNSPASDAQDTGEDFAAHLPPEEASRTPARRGETREATASTEEVKSDETQTPEDASAEACMTLTAPVAPAVVRPQNSTVTIDLSAFIAQAATTDAPAATPKPATAPTPGPQAAPSALQNTPPTPQAAQTDAATPDAQPINTQAAPTKAAPALETIALPVTPSTTGEARALPRLRAGRSEATDIQGVEARPAASVASAPGANAQPNAAGVQTANAVQQSAAATPTLEKTATVDAMPVGEAMPAEQRAHAVNESTSTQAGHRATTPAALVAQHIIRRFEGRSTSIDVRLDPPELGRVQISLEVGADNKVKAVVAAENPATLSDLVRSARELERALQDAGLELDAGGLSFDLAERGDNAPSEASTSGNGSGRSEGRGEALAQAPPVSRPFGLESWRGARVDVMA